MNQLTDLDTLPPLSGRRDPAWLLDAIFYQIYPQSFMDSNGDGIGDIEGIICKLDYLQSLGVNALWLNPVFVSPFRDAGYDIFDFYQVAPRYGTNHDLKRLFAEAHRRGMRVVLDLVAGHTSIEHPWFQASALPEKNEHTDWYIWTDAFSKCFYQAALISGYSARDGCFLYNFLSSQPSLNYGYANSTETWQQPMEAPGPMAVRRELQKIMQFWLDAGCDGFRVDMANCLIRNDTDGAAIRAFWRRFRVWFELEYPEAVLIAEWSNPINALTAGFHVDFLIHYGDPAYNLLVSQNGGCDAKTSDGIRQPPAFIQRAPGGDMRAFLERYLVQYEATHTLGYIALPTGNHDFPRPRHGRTLSDLRVLFAMLLTMPGVPFLYYGDEIGMRYIEGMPSKEGSYSRAGSRNPMQWESASPNFGFSTASDDLLYLPVDSSSDAPTVSAQANDPKSLYNLVRRLLALRREYARSLGNRAAFTPLYAVSGEAPFIYARGEGNARVIVVINPMEKTTRVGIPLEGRLKPLLCEGVAIEEDAFISSSGSFGLFTVSD